MDKILHNRVGKYYPWMRYLFTQWNIMWSGTISGNIMSGGLPMDFEIHILEGRLHCDKNPAYLESQEGGWYRREWYAHGQHHREDEPALITPTSDEWITHGRAGRSTGPATVIYQVDDKRNRIKATVHEYIGHPTKTGIYHVLDDGSEVRQGGWDSDIPF